MPDMIRDGAGKGYLAKVNKLNQLLTIGTTVEQRLTSTVLQSYYEAYSGRIELTDANEKGIIYIDNEDTSGLEIVIDRVFYDIWTSTGGPGGDGILRYYSNPTITGGTSIIPINTYFGSSSEPPGVFLKSLTTISGTEWWTAYITDKISMFLEEGRVILPKGRSFGISIQAPTGNTSMYVGVNIAFYYFNSDLAV